ncbi:MAG: rhodanese-like domain-containing protein [Ferruginibacter sp.]
MNDLQQMLNDPNSTILDVRSTMEFEQEHLSKAKNIPLDQIAYQLEEIKKMPKPIVLYCRSGARSGMAMQILKEAGIHEVYNGGAISSLQFLLN